MGYGVGKVANWGLKKLGLKKQKQKVNPDGSINVRIVGDETTGPMSTLESVAGGEGGPGGSMKKWFNKQKQKFGFGLKKDATGRFRDARGRFAKAPKLNIAGKLGDFGASMKGKFGGVGNALKGRLGGFAGKLGGGKLFAKLGARAIPGLGTAMLAFDAAKFLGPKLLKGVKSLGPALLGGVKKFGGAMGGLMKRATAVPRAIAGGVLKGAGGLLKGGWNIMKGIGGGIKKGLGKLKFWADGTDNTSSNKVGIAGERGPELIVPPPRSAVINNTAMTNAAMGAMSMGPALNDLATAVSKLNDRPIEVTTNPVMVERTLNRAVNKYNGAPGSSPASGM
jgi:hypothetical protein